MHLNFKTKKSKNISNILIKKNIENLENKILRL